MRYMRHKPKPSDNLIDEITAFYAKKGSVYGIQGTARKFNVSRYHVEQILLANQIEHEWSKTS